MTGFEGREPPSEARQGVSSPLPAGSDAGRPFGGAPR